MEASCEEKSSITLTPAGKLRIGREVADWPRKLFAPGAEQCGKRDPVFRFWRGLAIACISEISHIAMPDASPDKEAALVECLKVKDKWLPDCAPPMPGGEYLDQSVIEKISTDLLAWCALQIREKGGIRHFLEIYAPDWRQVGRLFFHLGENKLDSERPFAFLATYVDGLNEKGEMRHILLGEAIKRYADNKAAIGRILEPLRKIVESADWARDMNVSGKFLKACAWTPEQAYKFLLSAPEMEKCGIGLRLPDWWKKRQRPKIMADVSIRNKSMLGVDALIDFDVRVALGEDELSQSDMDKLLGQKSAGLVLIRNQWVEADSEKLGQALNHWRVAQKMAEEEGIAFNQGMRFLAGLEMDSADNADEEIIREWSIVRAGNGFREVLQGARKNALFPASDIPGFRGTLRPYQADGVAWMRFLNDLGLGACLADDMGLGKTIQVLSLLLLEKGKHEQPALLVAPASLLANWKSECARFAPDLRVLTLHASENRIKEDDYAGRLAEFDLVITSYAMCVRLPWLEKAEWSRVIADEAQNIKNAQTKQSRAVRALRSSRKIALTGTPIENRIADLWSLFDFINPGLLGTSDKFGKILKKLEKSSEGYSPIRKVTAPYILRRMKTDKNIISSLPEKLEMRLGCTLSREQARLYQKVVIKMERDLKDSASGDASKNRNALVLRNLLLLKQICNHPAQAGFSGKGGYGPTRSGKFVRLGELCGEIASRQEKVLIFTQFREIIPPLENFMEKIFGMPGLVLHGRTPVKKRGELVNEFQKEDGPPFFILSLKAGGSGLNLTQASHVIHFDRWWNPAVEEQATDRAFRIGQKKNVMVHKCVTLGTLEEKIDALITGKKELAGKFLDNIDNNIVAMSDSEIINLVSLDANALL